MTADMIGIKTAIIVAVVGPFQFTIVNPMIIKKLDTFQTEEGCLYLERVRPCKRYEEKDNAWFSCKDLRSCNGRY